MIQANRSASSLLLAVISFQSCTLLASNLETVSVTASRTPVAIRDVNSAISIIDKSRIQDRGYIQVADLLREVAGVSVSQQGARGSITQVRMRGAEANQVLVLIDGIEMNDLSQGSEFNFANLTTSQVNRIEIVRGPQSAIWGSDAVSGVINIITEDPATLGHHIEGSVNLGSFDTHRVGANYSYGDERFSFSVSGEQLDTDGTNISRQGDEKDGFTSHQLQLKTRYALNDAISLSLFMRGVKSSSDFDGTDFIVTGLPHDTDHHSDNEQRLTRIGLTMDQGRGIMHHLNLSRISNDNVTDAGNIENDITRGDKDQVSYQLDWSVSEHLLTGLLEWEAEHYAQRGAASFYGDPNKNLATHTNSLGLEYRYMGDKLDVSVSARWENNSDFRNSTSWRATAGWPISHNFDIYASLGEASKNPTFTERFGYYDNFIGNPTLTPETSLSAEVGLKGQFGEDVQVRVNHFRAKLKDEINSFVYDAAAGGFTAANESGESDRQGAELEVTWQPGSHTTLDAQYTYLDASEANAYRDEVRRPRHRASISVAHNWEKTTLSTSISYTGKQLDDFFPPYPPFQQQVSLDSFVILDLHLQYQLNKQLSFSVSGRNLTDKAYEEVYGYCAPGRSMAVGIALNL